VFIRQINFSCENKTNTSFNWVPVLLIMDLFIVLFLLSEIRIVYIYLIAI